MELLVYTTRFSNRLKYTFDLILKDVIGIQYQFTSKKAEFEKHDGPKLSYGRNVIGNEIHIGASKLLFEIGVEDQMIEVRDYDGLKGFFPTGKNSQFGFDLFAASFYLVSRYEEYLPFTADRFGRFPAKESLAFQNGFLEEPVINLWAQRLKKILLDKYPDLKVSPRTFHYVPTFDVDSAYAFNYKGVFRILGGFVRCLIDQDIPQFKQRLRVLLGREKDPYDTFDWILELQKKYQLNPKFFFLVGDYGEFDKNIPLTVNEFKYLVKSMADYAEVGIHPSYASNDQPEKIKQEIDRLEKAINRTVKSSRQHFLKLSLPHTYQQLIEHEIFEDYTMGYASEIGFRASIATPFYFFDLDYEVQTKLKVNPFAFMDVALHTYKKYTTEEALERVKAMIHLVKEVDGTLINVWHNQNLADIESWVGWRDLYEKITAEAFVVQVTAKYDA